MAFGLAGFQAAPSKPPSKTDAPSGHKSATKARTKPAPKPTPVPIFEGMVRGPDGKPVEGARVTYREIVVLGSDPAPSVRTDAEGRFRASLKSGAPLQVRVEAKGLAGKTIEKVQPGAPLLVTLDRGRTIEGLVRDAGGQPVARARVEANANVEMNRSSWDVEGYRVETTTDARGHFRLTSVGHGLHNVRARAPGRGAAWKGNVRPGSTVNLVLQPRASLTGIVADVDGRPVAGAVVRADQEAAFWGGSDTEKTDHDGRFDLLGLEAGTYSLVADHPDFAPAIVSGILVEEAGQADATLVLSRGFAVTGRLVGPEERPVLGRAVVQESADRPTPRSFAELLRAETGADGRFRIERVPAGSFVLGVLARGYAGRRVELDVSGRESVVDLGDISLEAGLAIRGRVRTRESAPIAGAVLQAYQSAMMHDGTPGETLSEPDGSFVLAGLSPGQYTVNVRTTGFARLHKPITAGSEDVDLVLEPGGAITGVVVEEGDQPVDAYSIEANPAKPEQRFQGRIFESVGSADGRFLLEDLAEDKYVLQVMVPERAPASVSSVAVAPERTTDVGVIRVARGGVVRGLVVDTSGGAVVGANVRVQGPGQDMMRWSPNLATESDPTGAFEIRGVPEGPKHVSASHRDYAPADAQVDVVAARGPAETRLILSQGGRIEGSARKRDGTPLTGLHVNAHSMGGGHLNWGAQPHATTGADGRFALDHVRPGQTSVSLMTTGSGAAGMSVSTNMQSKTVEVREGETVMVDFLSREILVTGHVTRSGTPLAAVRIQLMGEMGTTFVMGGPLGNGVAAAPTGPQRLKAVTNDDGYYELIVDDPGKYHAWIESQDSRRSYPSRELEIPDVETHTADLAFSGVPITGVVVDKDNEQPVAQAAVHIAPKAKTDDSWQLASGGRTGPDGRFQIEADPGDYTLSAQAEGYGQARIDVSVSSAGLSDVRLEMERGLEIRGRVLDSRGRALSGIGVHARNEVEGFAGFGWAQTLPDGTFRMSGLAAKPYNLCAGAQMVGYAIKVGVQPGDGNLAMTLRPAGTVRLLVKGPDGKPLSKAYASVKKVGNAVVDVPFTGGRGPTDSSGLTEIPTPGGVVEIEVRKEKLKATTRISVGEGATVDAEVTLTQPSS
jgi:protocatechuate 3,4-dioxygenase beta subunit